MDYIVAKTDPDSYSVVPVSNSSVAGFTITAGETRIISFDNVTRLKGNPYCLCAGIAQVKDAVAELSAADPT